MATDPAPRRMTVEEYLAFDRASTEVKYEYYDGYVLALAGGSLKHSRIKVNCTSALNAALRGQPCQTFDSDARVQVSAARYVYPDATVSCAPEDIADGDIVRAPRVIFEVLSPSTEKVDKGRKLRQYRTCPSIAEYVIVNTEQPLIEVYRRGGELLSYFSYGREDILDLPSIGVQIPVADIYGDIEFPPEEDIL